MNRNIFTIGLLIGLFIFVGCVNDDASLNEKESIDNPSLADQRKAQVDNTDNKEQHNTNELDNEKNTEQDVEKAKDEERDDQEAEEKEEAINNEMNKEVKKAPVNNENKQAQQQQNRKKVEKKSSEPKIEKKTETKTEEIKFKTIEEKDANLAKGKTTVKQEGKKGKVTITYEVTYQDGKKINTKEVSRKVIEEPRHKIVAVGTKEEVKQPNIGNASLEDEVINLVNNIRKQNGLSPLKKNSTVTQISREHSKVLANNYQSKGELSLWHSNLSNVRSRGVNATMIGENVAGGYPTAKATVQAWMNSPGHKANILKAEFTHTGVGYAEYNGVTFYTQIFYK